MAICMSEALPVLTAGVSGAEEESRSILATTIAQIITLVRNVITYLMEYIKKIISWSGEHPLAMVMSIVNFAIWVS